MLKQLIFTVILVVTIAAFGYTVNRLIKLFRLTKPAFPVRDWGKRVNLLLKVALGQSKIFRRPVVGFFHALVFWGFCIIIFGSIEMVIDGISGAERSLSFLGPVYDVLMAAGDIFALLVGISIMIFTIRRSLLHVKRFTGEEMKSRSHVDAIVSLSLILLLMVSLILMNTGYLGLQLLSGTEIHGSYPVSRFIAGLLPGLSASGYSTLYHVNWWVHILTIFFFANYLPYSKHFHVFMSVPNVFLSRLDPPGKLDNMESITGEVKLMLNPDTACSQAPAGAVPERFGVKDAGDVTWKNYFDSLSCTECGRCTSVCPANLTGKKLSPRKVMMNLRARMKEIGPLMVKNGQDYTDNRSLVRDYVSEEELWACTTCNACVQECPVNINQPSLIVDMRRYLVLEEGAAPGELKSVFSNIENNGAPWQYPADDRLNWTKNLDFEIPVFAGLPAETKPEYLFWVGCAGAFDDRYKKVVRAFAGILNRLNVSYAVLGKEETCTGDPARRAGNEMLFQMQAMQVIEILKNYEVKKIITTCPHCFNTFKNEYPDLGGNYEVISYLQFLESSISEGKLKLDHRKIKGTGITFHDPCYLGRANNIYSEPREIIKTLSPGLVEMKRNKSFALCCGAGGGQMFKEAEKGDQEIFIERTGEALETGADTIATACPFCMTMITDGLKYKNREENVRNLDIAELVAEAMEM